MTASSFHDDVVLIPGPADFHIDLSALDARHGLYYSRKLHIFRCDSPAQRDAQLVAFKQGLQALLLHCPILGGVVAAPTEDLWRTIMPGQCGIELTVKDLRKKMPSLSELEKDNFKMGNYPWDLLIPVPVNLDDKTPYPAWKTQFSAIEGGTILTFSMSHNVADGNGQDRLMSILANEVRLAQDPKSEPASSRSTNKVGMDRSPVRNIKSNNPFKVEDHPAYRWRTEPLQTPSSHPFEATAPEPQILLRLSPASLAQLKADATTPNASSISTHDAICALIWRSQILIRSRRSPHNPPPSTQTTLFMPSDARRQLGLPSTYVGNAVYQLIAHVELGDLLSSTGLQHAALALRRAITDVTPERVTSYMSLLNNDPEKASKLGWQFENGTIGTTSVAMGTCLGSGPVLYGSDWGEAFGPMLSFRLIDDEGGADVMPRLPDGSVEVLVSVMEDEVEMLRSAECFGKYCS